MDSFVYDGVRYYQQFRKCGKSSCMVCRRGEGHGPYWYARDISTGARSYVGKALPAKVQYAHGVLSRSVTRLALRSALADLQAGARSIEVLLSGGRLSDSQKRRLAALGFGECVGLVSEPASQVAQDTTLRALGASELPGLGD